MCMEWNLHDWHLEQGHKKCTVHELFGSKLAGSD